MKDKEILEEVYRRLCDVSGNWHNMNMDRMFDRVHDMKDMIEQEWQKEDEADFEWRLFEDGWYKKDKNLEKASISDKNNEDNCGKTMKIYPKTCQQKQKKD